MAAFGSDFDLEALARSWASDDPRDLNRAYCVQAGFENVLNNCVRIAQDLCDLEGWGEAGGRGSALDALRLLHEQGVITAQTREALKHAQERRSLIQHDYVRVVVREVHAAVRNVLEHAPLLLQDVAAQLRQRE